MAANAQVYQTTSVTNSTIVTTTETIVATIPSVSANQYGQIVRVEGMIGFTAPADASAVVLKVRRNTVTGTQVGATITYQVTPTGVYLFEISAIASEPVGLHTYVITMAVTGASANTTVTNAVATVIVGN